MMRIHTLAVLPLLFAASHADTIHLKNGTSFEGTILRDEGDAYIAQIQVTKSIRDERRIPKADILQIVEEKLDQAAFEAIQPLAPSPDLLDAADYERRLALVNDFIKRFPRSTHARDAEAIRDTLAAEHEAVAAGGIKFDGRLISPSERQAHAYPLDAAIAAAGIRRLAESGEYLAALRAWDEFEARFAASNAYRDTLPLARQLMDAQRSNIQQSLASFDSRIREREKGLERIPDNDRQRTERALADEAAAYARRLAAAKQSGQRWLPLDPYHRAPLEESHLLLTQELERLSKIDPSTLGTGETAWNSTQETLRSNPAPADIRAALADARQAGLPDEYLELLEKSSPTP